MTSKTAHLIVVILSATAGFATGTVQHFWPQYYEDVNFEAMLILTFATSILAAFGYLEATKTNLTKGNTMYPVAQGKAVNGYGAPAITPATAPDNVTTDSVTVPETVISTESNATTDVTNPNDITVPIESAGNGGGK